MTAVFRRFIGGAGTGKTRLILEEMNNIRDQLRLDPLDIGFATFTRAGRAEMAERAATAWGCTPELLTKSDGHFRTVHSTAMCQLGLSKDEILACDAESDDWISKKLGAGLIAENDDTETSGFRPLEESDAELAMSLRIWDYSRATCTPVKEILAERAARGEPVPSMDVIDYAVSRYETCKRVEGKSDFCDLLGRFAGIRFSLEGIARVAPEGDDPEGVQAYFFDECQDASALVDAVCRRLAAGRAVKYVALAGDPYQSIYGTFGGGNAAHFLSWEAAEQIMPRSYRCPEGILALGERCLREMSQGYRDRGIRPAEHPGTIHYAGDIIDAIYDHLTPPVSTLILARCEYALRPYIEELRVRHLPFARLSEPESPRATGFMALWEFSQGMAVRDCEWVHAVPLIAMNDSQGNLLVGKNTRFKWENGMMPLDDFVCLEPQYLAKSGCTSAFVAILANGHWIDVLRPSVQAEAVDWDATRRQWGDDAVRSPPIRVGTIHAAKGAEADTVILSTQTSKRVERGRDTCRAHHDEECRVAYVGVTRAKKRLVILDDGTQHRMHLPLL